MPRPITATIHPEAVRHNLERVRQAVPDAKLWSVVKANAYGHGAVLISQELNHLGVNAFCVASAEEGAELRKNGIRGEILILGRTVPPGNSVGYGRAFTAARKTKIAVFLTMRILLFIDLSVQCNRVLG